MLAFRDTVKDDRPIAFALPELVSSRLEESDNLKNFLASKGTQFKPRPLPTDDVFISYAEEDESVAEEMLGLLQARDLKCFMATKNIQSGMLWKEQIRDALNTSRSVLLLLTRNSVASQWVMCEAFAFWALRKPIVPAYMFASLSDIPALITEFQCKRVDSADDRRRPVE